jgi:hypothetical protein
MFHKREPQAGYVRMRIANVLPKIDPDAAEKIGIGGAP